MKNRSGEKIRLASIEEMLGMINKEYEMIFGHRRMQVAELAGLTTISAIVREVSAQLVGYEMPEKPTEHLSCNLGELLAGMKLQLVWYDRLHTLQKLKTVHFSISFV